MSINAAQAAQAYARSGAAAAAGGVAGVEDKVGAAQGPSFDDVLKEAMETGKTAETMTMKAAAGEAELIDVVSAVTAAEVTLESVVAVRDRVIGAYQEIMRMPI